MATTAIVQVQVSVIQAPTPSTLQQTGAFISQGATTTAPGTLTLLASVANLTSILSGAHAISTLVWASSVVTVTTAAPHGLTIGETIQITIAGAVPVGYNGTFSCTITGTSAFTYPLVSNPGTMSTPGTYSLEDIAELLAMATTFFAQGNGMSVYVLELGPGQPTDGITYLTTWLQNNPLTVYGFLVPRTWDSVSSFLTLITQYNAPTAMTYFWVTTTVSNYTNYTSLMKSAITLVEAPTIPATEFSLAAPFYHALNYRPSSTNRVAPFNYSYVFGCTPYPTIGNGALFLNLKNAATNIIQTGAEGGVVGTIITWGTTKDGRDYTYWYSVDWTQINLRLDLANEIINGANNPVNPLYYDQHGINRLQGRAAGTMSRAITFGLAVGTVTQIEYNQPVLQTALDTNQFTAVAVVNAVPFTDYAIANPGDYKTGFYAGLSVIYIPQRGFSQILVNLVVSDFVQF